MENVVSSGDSKSARKSEVGGSQRTRGSSFSQDIEGLTMQHQAKLERLIQLGFPRAACAQALQNVAYNVRQWKSEIHDVMMDM